VEKGESGKADQDPRIEEVSEAVSVMDTELLAQLLVVLQEAVRGEVDLRNQEPVAVILTVEGLRALWKR
jgi:hypothetical protein